MTQPPLPEPGDPPVDPHAPTVAFPAVEPVTGEGSTILDPRAKPLEAALAEPTAAAPLAEPTLPAEPAESAEFVLESGEVESPAIEVEQLVKRFAPGDPPALQGIDLIVPRGEIYGFIGPNGAGKTTTLRILATLTPATAGRASICGFDCATQPEQVRRRMGYLPDGAPAVPDFTVGEFLEFFAAAYGILGERRRDVVRDVLALVDLSPKRDRPIAALSLGMRQRLGLARVLLHDPEVLLLDEPGTGLDPRARIEIREVLRELRSLGKTILVSSHILGELNELCTSIGILEQGRVVFSGPLEAALARVRGGTFEIRVGGGPQARARARALLQREASVEEVVERSDQDLLLVELVEGASSGAAARALVTAGHELLILRPRAIDLEDAFLTLTEGKLA